ncbi:hypothetical protein ACFPYI_09140 [Halomarina salina]|uniref:Uncharacterized protein n=1 Tax=Halomarina salina TaxID=1872699 RepID=A0ABD5RLQ0_9EURY|nr:hypothetical protein [Halomarina salina]
MGERGPNPDDLPNLDAVNIDASKPTEEYTPTERRADILARLREAGCPANLPSQRDLGEQYGMSQSVISRDVALCVDYLAENLSTGHVATTKLAYDRALAGALDDEEWEAASRIAERRSNWIEARTLLRDLDAKLDSLAEHLDAGDADLSGTTGTLALPELVTVDGDDGPLVAELSSDESSATEHDGPAEAEQASEGESS